MSTPVAFATAARLVALMLFFVGIAINLVLGCLAAPDLLQVMSDAVRNLGLMVMGHPILLKSDAGSPAALISAQLPRTLACGRESPPIPRQSIRDLQVV